jgi:hypothetical protein
MDLDRPASELCMRQMVVAILSASGAQAVHAFSAPARS